MSSEPSGPSRRSVSAGALWSIPVVSAAVAAPLAAASTAPCTSVTMFTESSISTNPVALTATSPAGARTTVRITSILAPDTTTTTTAKSGGLTGITASYNLTQGGTVWFPGGTNLFVNEVPTPFYEPGLLLLNQRRAGPVSTQDAIIREVPTPGSPSQTLIFEFLDAEGKVFDPVDVQLTFLNILSGVLDEGRAYWARKFWTTVGFSVAPTSISSRGGNAGVGAGTIADPFRRATSLELVAPLSPRYDTFRFRSFPSGSSLVYSQFGGYQGWQSSAITGLAFGASDC